MNKLLILCCFIIISIINATPIKTITINEILQQLEFLKKCPAVLNNNIDIHKLDGGLSHCKNVVIGNAPEKIDLQNLNEFHCIGLLAADIQLCSGNKTNKLPNNYDDLKTNIDKIKNEKTEKICNELKKLKLFDEIEKGTNLQKWAEVLDKNLHAPSCLGFCLEVDTGNTNLLCSMIYYINNNISYVTIPEKKVIQVPLSKEIPSIIAPQTNKDNMQQKVDTSPLTDTDGLKANVQEKITVTQVNVKENAAIKVEPKVVNPVGVGNTAPGGVVNTAPGGVVNTAPSGVVNNQLEGQITADKPPKELQTADKPPKEVQTADKPPKEVQAVLETTTIKPVPKQKDSVTNTAPEKTVQVTQETKQQQQQQLEPVKQNPVSEENQKVPTNVESSSISSTISGVRDELNEDYFEEVDEINKENEDQLIAQTNPRKEAIEILANEQDRHRMPSEEGEDMEESNFFSYFMFVSVMFIAGYVVYHNKQKIMALLLEGRRDRNSRRRPNTASYRKLNSNLEEAVTSKCSGSASHVIY